MSHLDTVKRIAISEDETKPVLRCPYSEMLGAYFILSFRGRRISEAHLNFYIKYQKPWPALDTVMSFFYANETHGAEWVPCDGPIMLYTRCKPDWTGATLMGSPLKAKEHWFFDYVEDNAMAWSQLAVDDERLVEKLNNGDFDGIFNVLKRWAARTDA